MSEVRTRVAEFWNDQAKSEVQIKAVGAFSGSLKRQPGFRVERWTIFRISFVYNRHILLADGLMGSQGGEVDHFPGILCI